MSVTPSFRAFVEDQLGEVTPVRSRAMFGGVGLYAGELFFGLIADDILYLKADEETREIHERRGLRPFRPSGDGAKPMSYYEVPPAALEDPDEIRPWVERSIEVARRARRGSG